jgi:hypothetical protein
MKTRIVIYRRHRETSMVEFGISPELTFVKDIDSPNLDAFAAAHALRRCADFDWAVGDAGRVCALFELTALPLLPWFERLVWHAFPSAARLLKEGEDKRFLQLAVQYIAAGGVDDSVLATDYDKNFLDTIRTELEKQWEKEPPK